MSSTLSLREFITAFLLLNAVYSFIAYQRDILFLPQGPSVEMAQTAVEIWEHGRIESPRFYELFHMLARQSVAERQGYWQDVFAQAHDGRLLPKHCLLASLLSAPFYGVFGKAGFWIFEQLCLLVTALSVLLVSARVSQRAQPYMTLMFCTLGSQLLYRSYSFDYDVLAASLVMGGLSLLWRSPLFGGFLMGMSVFVRPTYGPLVIPLALFGWEERRRAGVLDGLAGMGAAFTLFLASNWYLWGGPLTTVYHRFPGVERGELIFTGGSMRFKPEIFWAEWGRKLFDGEVGLLLYNPVLISVLLLPFLFLVRARFRYSLLLAVLAAAGQFIIVFSYDGWSVSPYGNRYLTAVIALLLVVGLASSGALRSWLGRPPSKPFAPS